MLYSYSNEKDAELRQRYGMGFQDIIPDIENGLLAILDHHNHERYPTQKVFAVQRQGYVYAVPFVEQESGSVFLKTFYPSRKLKKRFKEQELL